MSLVRSALIVLALSMPATAAAEEALIGQLTGEWQAKGQILVGEASGLEFYCTLSGEPKDEGKGFGVGGKCWSGELVVPVFGRVRYNRDQDRYFGSFMGGAKSIGVDVQGTAHDGGFRLELKRDEAEGEVTATIGTTNDIDLVLSLTGDGGRLRLPVAAMGLRRTSATASLD